VKHKHLVITLGAIITSTLFLLNSCRKINEATTLGGGLIPPVDNINTFDTTLEVEAYNELFTLLNDSTRVSYNANQVLGYVSNDPLFGQTDARMFLELKPTSYPFTFANLPDSVTIDSVVLILQSAGVWGDTNVNQTVNVYELDQANSFRNDTSYLVRQNNLTYSHLLGSRTFAPSILNDSISAYLDSNTVNQLRIRLDNSFGTRLIKYDTSAANNPYLTDSAFRTKFKGFALQAQAGGNALMEFNLTGANTKLGIYYKYEKKTATNQDPDTAVAYFNFKPYETYGTASSASANYVIRDYSGAPIQAVQGGTTPDQQVFIQNTPGSFARIRIPGLSGLSNRVVHRAELIMEQIYDISDSTFPARNLMLDVYDPSLSSYRFMPYDFTFDLQGTPALGAFGSGAVNSKNQAGQNIKTWHFNLSRYVQNVVNGHEQVFEMRLFAPYYINDIYKPTINSTTARTSVTVNGTVGQGRVRLYGGDPTVPATNPQRMRMRIVYSKL
jgi:hypothetical protein